MLSQKRPHQAHTDVAPLNSKRSRHEFEPSLSSQRQDESAPSTPPIATRLRSRTADLARETPRAQEDPIEEDSSYQETSTDDESTPKANCRERGCIQQALESRQKQLPELSKLCIEESPLERGLVEPRRLIQAITGIDDSRRAQLIDKPWPRVMKEALQSSRVELVEHNGAVYVKERQAEAFLKAVAQKNETQRKGLRHQVHMALARGWHEPLFEAIRRESRARSSVAGAAGKVANNGWEGHVDRFASTGESPNRHSSASPDATSFPFPHHRHKSHSSEHLGGSPKPISPPPPPPPPPESSFSCSGSASLPRNKTGA